MLWDCFWLSVIQLKFYHSVVLMYKTLQTTYPKYIFSKLSSEYPYNTRLTRSIFFNFYFTWIWSSEFDYRDTHFDILAYVICHLSSLTYISNVIKTNDLYAKYHKNDINVKWHTTYEWQYGCLWTHTTDRHWSQAQSFKTM